MSSYTPSTYRTILTKWASLHPRPMPWKGIRDPYRIWLSEIILQQTRVEQGLPYYERFAATYPTITDLAQAPDDEVFKLWEGLGYYSRARNMLAAARMVADELGGHFPDTYEGIRALKGVGDYTAAAIGSFAYDLPYAVLDGNVFRVLARWFGIETPTDSTEGKRQFVRLAQEILDSGRPGAHNQAMMDFGATWCTPKNPKCSDCPFSAVCEAKNLNKVSLLPVKSKKTLQKERFFLYCVVDKAGKTFLQKREQKDIWQNLYDFPHIEPDTLPTDTITACGLLGLPAMGGTRLSKIYRQTLTHRKVAALFLEIPWTTSVEVLLSDCVTVNNNTDLPEIAVPRIIEWYWKEKGHTLTLF